MIDLVGYSGVFSGGGQGRGYFATEYRCILEEGDLPLSIATHEWRLESGLSVALFQENFFTSIPYYKNTHRYRLLVDDVVVPISEVKNQYSMDGTVAPEVQTFQTPEGELEMHYVRQGLDSFEFDKSATWCGNDLELFSEESYIRYRKR